MTGPDPVGEYLGQLRASLRFPGASLILAEAEDHLREAVTAGLAAGLTELEAQEAAISSFGSVRAVVRAHRARRRRAAAVLGDLALTAWKLAGLFLLAFCLSALVTLADYWMRTPPVAMQVVGIGGVVVEWITAGMAGLALLAGCHLVRRFRRRRGRAVMMLSGEFFPPLAAVFFGTAAAVLALLRISGAAHVAIPPILATLALAVGYAVRMRWTFHRAGDRGDLAS
jgi:hypothetical protein